MMETLQLFNENGKSYLLACDFKWLAYISNIGFIGLQISDRLHWSNCIQTSIQTVIFKAI